METGFCIGDDELGALARVGDRIACPRCGAAHALAHERGHGRGDVDGGVPVYRCGSTSYLAGVGGYLVSVLRHAPRSARRGEVTP